MHTWLGRHEKQKTSAQFSLRPRSKGFGASLYTPRTFSYVVCSAIITY